jgi:hypothetical protein
MVITLLEDGLDFAFGVFRFTFCVFRKRSEEMHDNGAFLSVALCIIER